MASLLLPAYKFVCPPRFIDDREFEKTDMT
jgi:hypothetical protein